MATCSACTKIYDGRQYRSCPHCFEKRKYDKAYADGRASMQAEVDRLEAALTECSNDLDGERLSNRELKAHVETLRNGLLMSNCEITECDYSDDDVGIKELIAENLRLVDSIPHQSLTALKRKHHQECLAILSEKFKKYDALPDFDPDHLELYKQRSFGIEEAIEAIKQKTEE